MTTIIFTIAETATLMTIYLYYMISLGENKKIHITELMKNARL